MAISSESFRSDKKDQRGPPLSSQFVPTPDPAVFLAPQPPCARRLTPLQVTLVTIQEFVVQREEGSHISDHTIAPTPRARRFQKQNSNDNSDGFMGPTATSPLRFENRRWSPRLQCWAIVTDAQAQWIDLTSVFVIRGVDYLAAISEIPVCKGR